jgi:hypothetical protein
MEKLRQGFGGIHGHRRRRLFSYISSSFPIDREMVRHTDIVSQDEVPTFFAAASFRNRS